MLRALDLTGKVQPGSVPACTLPLRAEVLGTLCCQELRQRAADVREHGRYRGGDLVNAGDGSQSDQANEKGILDQILTFLAVHQVLKLHIHCQKKVVHFISSPIGFPQPQPGTLSVASGVPFSEMPATL
jgi:hypothetical protein